MAMERLESVRSPAQPNLDVERNEGGTAKQEGYTESPKGENIKDPKWEEGADKSNVVRDRVPQPEEPEKKDDEEAAPPSLAKQPSVANPVMPDTAPEREEAAPTASDPNYKDSPKGESVAQPKFAEADPKKANIVRDHVPDEVEPEEKDDAAPSMPLKRVASLLTPAQPGADTATEVKQPENYPESPRVAPQPDPQPSTAPNKMLLSMQGKGKVAAAKGKK